MKSAYGDGDPMPRLRQTKPSPRVMLDTNVWNYLAAHANAEALVTAARSGDVSIVVAPAVVYESMAVTDEATLHARAHLLTHKAWKRVMPEAYGEAQEVLREARRLRPEWLLEHPPRSEFKRLYRDWRDEDGGFWSRVRRFPLLASETIRDTQQEMLNRAREETKDARKHQVESTYPVWSAPLGKYWADIPRIPGGSWEDTISVAAWRADAYEFWSRHIAALRGQPTPVDAAGGYIDWLSAELDFEKLKSDTASWYNFWLFEVDETAMPRRWLRWAAGLLQQFSGWSRGTPGDNQLSTYMIDADVFVTADTGLHRIVEKMHAETPFSLARPILVSANKSGCRETLELVGRGAK
nr:hypothetical protein [Nitrosomonas nitrosa]